MYRIKNTKTGLFLKDATYHTKLAAQCRLNGLKMDARSFDEPCYFVIVKIKNDEI